MLSFKFSAPKYFLNLMLVSSIITSALSAQTPAPSDIYVGYGYFSGEYYDFFTDQAGNNQVNISDYITYIPIRSENNREMSFNKSFYKIGSELEEIKDKYLGGESKKDEIYEQVSWIYQK